MDTIVKWINDVWPTVGAMLLGGVVVGFYYVIKDLVVSAWKELEL